MAIWWVTFGPLKPEYSSFSSKFQRIFPIPPNVDETNVQFETNEDEITIKFPKKKFDHDDVL